MHTPDLHETLTRLDDLTDWERRPRDVMRVGLDPMLDLMLRLGDPHLSFRSVHVAGTKGKGSVCALVEAGLFRAGYNVGRYSSPHLQHVTERISIDQTPVDETCLAGALTIALDAYEEARRDNTAAATATWFDVMTAAAFVAFREAGVEWAVVEVGLGGRLDSTNVIDAEVAVVTNIELEHTEVLGSTRAEIAREKVGILKSGAVLVTPLPIYDAAGDVLQERADCLGCPVLRTTLRPGSTIDDRNAELAVLVLDHLGRQGVQAVSAYVLLEPVGAWLLDQTVRESARLPGRMERVDIEPFGKSVHPAKKVSVVLDGAHVPFNLEAVMRDLHSQPAFNGPCVAVVALAGDKDAGGLLSTLSRFASHIVFTELPVASRGHGLASLATIAESLGVVCDAIPDQAKAFERSIRLASDRGQWVIVTGSLHLVGIVRSFDAVVRAIELQ
jgi:dihydrofolate synthase / folylpolyglutamate synthase